MKLHWTPTSPYARKCMIAARERGLDVEGAPTNVGGETLNAELLPHNPLHKVPTLVRDDGSSLFDSGVICEYLDGLGGARRLYPAGEARFETLRLHALGQGLTDMLIAWRMEAIKEPQAQNAYLIAKTQKKLPGILAELDGQAGDWPTEPGIGQIAVGCAIAYFDFRFPDQAWRQAYPALAAWYEGWAARPAVVATPIPQ